VRNCATDDADWRAPLIACPVCTPGEYGSSTRNLPSGSGCADGGTAGRSLQVRRFLPSSSCRLKSLTALILEWDLGQAVAIGINQQFQPVRHFQFRIDGGEMVVHCNIADEQLFSDLPVF